MTFHGWKIYKLNDLWNCKPINCDYPVQTFYYVIDAMIYCKENPYETAQKESVAERVIGQMRHVREIRKARKSGECVINGVQDHGLC
jgi:hypothetical protein